MLKKIIITLIIFCTLLVGLVNVNTPLFSAYADKFEVCLNKYKSSSAFVTVNNAEYRFIGKKSGESCKVKGVSAKKILEDFNATTVLTEKVDGNEIIYAYSEKIPYLEQIDGQKVNLQIAVENGNITVGAPLIYGSF